MKTTDVNYLALKKSLWYPFHWCYDVQVSGKENFDGLDEWKRIHDVPSKGGIIVSNHKSFIDHFAIIAGLGKESFIHFVAIDYNRVNSGSIQASLFNKLYKRTGQVVLPRKRLGRDGYETMRQSIQKIIEQDRYVVVYPEGRINSGEDLGRFQLGAAHTAYGLHAALIPIRLEGVSDVWPHHGRLKLSGEMRIKVGMPINPRDPQYNGGKIGLVTTGVERIKIARTLTEVVRNEIERLGTP
ncbi:MAG: hypothetical protein RL557_678 [archaeon]|jgi:1-acyl-sn-glycerol-3-phosphate acyltransferase